MMAQVVVRGVYIVSDDHVSEVCALNWGPGESDLAIVRLRVPCHTSLLSLNDVPYWPRPAER